MPKIPQIKPKEIIKILLRQGFVQRAGRGSHMVLKHPDGRRTVIPIHNKPIATGTFASILKQVNFSVEEFLKLVKEK